MAVTLGPGPEKTPYRQPEVAAGNGRVALTFASGGAVMIAFSNDNGKSFASPKRVSEVPVLAAGRHRGPRALFVDREVLVSAVAGKTLAQGPHAHGLPSDGDLVVWRSFDTGRTWSAPSIVNDAPGAAREGFQSIVSDGHGQLAAVWLDLRNEGTRLYGAFSQDGGATWSKNILIYEAAGGTICQCCGPSMVSTGPGRFAVMFRNVVGGSRDLYMLRLENGKVVSKPEKIGLGTWTINACPMDGGGLAYSNGQLISAWRRDEDVFLSTPSSKETKIGSGLDISLAVSHGNPYVAWQKAGKISVWNAGKTLTLVEQGGGFPVLTSLPDGNILAAWEANGAIATRVLR
jgi:hypothetical protein